MSFLNQRGTQDARRILSGKDGCIFDEDGELLASVTQFTASVNINTQTYNPLGAMQTYKAPVSYEVTLTLNETVIETSKFIQDLYTMMNEGTPVYWSFQAVMRGYDGSEERVIFRDCLPQDSLDLINAQVGELWVRSWTLAVNSPPSLQNLLTYS